MFASKHKAHIYRRIEESTPGCGSPLTEGFSMGRGTNRGAF